MPKPVKKKQPTRTKSTAKPSDASLRAHQVTADHPAKAGEPTSEDDSDTAAIISAYMRVLGTRGGTVSGSKRMDMSERKRKEVAGKGAAARWGKAKQT